MLSYRGQIIAVTLVILPTLLTLGYTHGGLLGTGKAAAFALVLAGIFCFMEWRSNGSVRRGEGKSDYGGGWGGDWGDGGGGWDD
jgi:hypothetical protein